MTKSRLTHLLLLHVHKQETAKLDLDTIFEEFAGRNAERRNVRLRIVRRGPACTNDRPVTPSIVVNVVSCYRLTVI